METSFFNRNQLEELIEAIVDEEGIRPEYKGCKYINEAIYMVVEDEERLDALTKEVYGEIAISHHTSIPSVERTIRFAIKKLAQRSTYSGYSHQNLELQTNKAFIASMAHKVRHLETGNVRKLE